MRDALRTILIEGTLKGILVSTILSISYLLYICALLSLVPEPMFFGFAAYLGLILGVFPAIILGSIQGTITAILYLRLAPTELRTATILGVFIPVGLLGLFLVGAIIFDGNFAAAVFTPVALAPFYVIPIAVFILANVHFTREYFRRSRGDSGKIARFYRKILAWLYIPPLLLLAITISMRLVPLLWDQPNRLEFEMTWNVSEYSWCRDYIELEFVEFSGYQVSSCSESLANYLIESKQPTATLVLLEERAFFGWNYTVLQVGLWQADSTSWNGLSLSCSSSDTTPTLAPSSACGKQFPIKQPYMFHPSDFD